VAKNESVGRVFSLSAHLINTFLLLASLALTAWWSTKPAHVRPARLAPNTRTRLTAAIVALVLVALAGVITALGDTLFPAQTLAQGISQDFAATANFLIRLRVIHPALAIVTAMLIAAVAANEFRRVHTGPLHTLAGLLLILLAAQIVLGTLTVLLKAPIPMQLAHLLAADALWITLVLFVSERSQSRAPASP